MLTIITIRLIELYFSKNPCRCQRRRSAK